jgi:hypothetical protein
MAVQGGRVLLDDRDARFREMQKRDVSCPSVLRFLRSATQPDATTSPREQKPGSLLNVERTRFQEVGSSPARTHIQRSLDQTSTNHRAQSRDGSEHASALWSPNDAPARKGRHTWCAKWADTEHPP